MPGSYLKFKAEIVDLLRRELPTGKGIDVGAGAGFWADLFGWGKLDALEVWPEYIREFGLKSRYRRVFEGDARSFDRWDEYNFAVIGDVLEHLSVEDSKALLETLRKARIVAVVAVPYLSPQGPCNGNPHEEHLQPDLTPEVMAERYPELRLVIGDEVYGYYSNIAWQDVKPFPGAPVEHPLPPVPVLWWKGQKGYGDHGLVAAALAGELWPTPRLPTVERTEEELGNKGAIIVLPGRQNIEPEQVREVRRFLDARSWSEVLLTGDEEARFVPRSLLNGKSVVLRQTPGDNESYAGVEEFLPLGWRMGTLKIAKDIPLPPRERELWTFSGQGGHPKRAECISELGKLSGSLAGSLDVTPGFWQGAPYPEYLRRLSGALLCPSPSGPVTPDCFRTWEALEMGSLPVVDRRSPGPTTYSFDGYYAQFMNAPPDLIPAVHHWKEFKSLAEFARDGGAEFQAKINRASAWWIERKRDTFRDIVKSLFQVSGQTVPRNDLSDRVTILMPMSPIPAHPSISMIEENIRRIRSYPELERAEIIVMCDGIHHKLAHREADYEEAIRRLLWLAQRDIPGLRVCIFRDHTHQARMTRQVLRRHVDTPLVLFVEHDTFPVGRIPWERIGRVVEGGVGGVHLVRLQHYGGRVHPEHEWLLADRNPVEVGGLPVYKTKQWSQRPHLARADWYLRTLEAHFRPERRTMIEDVMHGWAEGAPWERYGLAIYAPEGDMKRSDTNDGRGDDPKIVEA